LGENLLRAIEIRPPHLHTNAANGAIEMPGLRGHDFVGKKALDAFRIQPPTQELRGGEFTEADKRYDVFGKIGRGHHLTLARAN
jgi:hypothetical protein